MVDWILDRVAEAGEVDAVHVVTNSVYAPAFEEWARDKDVVVHDDGTSSNDDRLGALGDVRFALRDGRLAGDDLLVIAADNLFEFPLSRYLDFWRSKGDGSALAVLPARRPVARAALRRRRARRERPDRRHGGEARASEERRRRDGDVPLLARARRRCSTATSTRGTPPTRPAATSRGSASASPSTGSASASSGSTSATRSSCSRPTTATARPPACRCGTHTASPAEQRTHLSQSWYRHVTAFAVP